MTVNMQKGGNVSLKKLAEEAGIELRHVTVACGWKANRRLFGSAYDLDMSAVGLDASGRVPVRRDPTDPGYQEYVIYPNHRYPSNRSIVFTGDNRKGSSGNKDDESIRVDLLSVPGDIERIVFEVVIWQAEERRQNFGKVKDAFIRIYDDKTGRELARFDLGDEFAEDTMVIFGELYRHGGEWKFRAIGQGADPATFRAEHGIIHPFETEWARY